MLEKLTRMLKIKQKLTLDPSSYDYFEMDRFSISRIEVTGRQSVSDNIPVTSTWVAIGLGLQAGGWGGGSSIVCNTSENMTHSRVFFDEIGYFWIADETLAWYIFLIETKTIWLNRELKSSKSMLVRNGYPNLLRGCDFLCFNLTEYDWVWEPDFNTHECIWALHINFLCNKDTPSPVKSACPYGMDRITLSPRMMQLILKIINQENAKIALQHSKSMQVTLLLQFSSSNKNVLIFLKTKSLHVGLILPKS